MASEEEIKELWALLFEDPRDLSDSQISQILGAQQEIREKLSPLWLTFPNMYEAVQRYRTRKSELSQKSTDELVRMRNSINAGRGEVLRSITDDDLGDSFFESPSIDSDEHIVYELLKEREASTTVPR